MNRSLHKIVARVIDHKCQRYPTAGDWWFEDGTLNIAASDTNNWKMDSLLMVHEIVEAILCKAHGISEPKVRKFDIEFDKAFPLEDPGDNTESPYRRQHCIATAVERILAAELNVPWDEYDKATEKLWEGSHEKP